MKEFTLAVIMAVTLLMGMVFFAGCGGGGKSDKPSASVHWTIRNLSGKFSGVTAA